MSDAIYHWSVHEGFVTIADGTTLSWEDSCNFLLEQASVGPTTYVHKSELAYGLAQHLKVQLSKTKLHDAMYVFMLELCDWGHSGDEAAQCAREIMRGGTWDEMHPKTPEELESLIIKDGDKIHLESPMFTAEKDK